MTTYGTTEIAKEVSEIIQNPSEITNVLEKNPPERVAEIAEELVKADPNYVKIIIILIITIGAIITPIFTVYFTR